MSSQPQPSRQRRGKILYILILGLVLTGFVPVFFVTQKLIRLYEEELRATLREKQLAQASAISEALDIYVEGARSRLARVVDTFTVLADRGDLDRAVGRRDFLDRFLEHDLILVRFENRRGRVHQAEPETPIPEAEVARLLAGAGASGEELISQPTYIPQAGLPVVVISRPVVGSRRVLGVASAVFNIAPIWNGIVNELNVPYTAYLLDRDGRLVAHTDPDAFSLPSPRHDLVAGFLGPARAQKETMPFRMTENGVEKLMLGTRVATRNGWGVFLQVEEAQAFGPVAAMKAEARAWQLGTLVVGIGAAILFAGYITRPIRKLTEVSRAFARGELHRRAEVGAHNELGELADTFNAMSEDLQVHITRLKQAADENHELFMGTIRALATAIDEKDPYTRGHSERVNRLSMVIGKHLELSEKEMRDLHIASLLHDVGKIGIDDRILRKPAALTDDEFEVMKQHPVRGANILAGVKALEPIIPGMKHHHERWSGGGYPDGLVGEQIPMMARIIQIADAYDAMTTNRPYQRAMRTEAAVARINELAGSVSDPRVVAAFNRAHRSGDLATEALRPGAPTARAIRETTRPVIPS